MAGEKQKEQNPKKSVTKDLPKNLTSKTAMASYLEALNILLHDLSAEKQTQNLRQKDMDWWYINSLLNKDINDSAFKEYLITKAKIRPQVGELEVEINKLKSEINEKAQSLLEQRLDAKQKEKQIQELET